MVVGKELGKDMVELVAAVVETYHNLLGVFCHSGSLALPPLEPQVGRCFAGFVTFQGGGGVLAGGGPPGQQGGVHQVKTSERNGTKLFPANKRTCRRSSSGPFGL